MALQSLVPMLTAEPPPRRAFSITQIFLFYRGHAGLFCGPRRLRAMFASRPEADIRFGGPGAPMSPRVAVAAAAQKVRLMPDRTLHQHV